MRNIGNLQVSGSLIVSGSTTITGVLSASSFIGDGSGLTGVTSYTDTDTLNFINSINVLSGSIDWDTLEGKPSGIVSSSSQVSFTGITNKPTLVSGSAQISSLGFTTCTGTVTSLATGTGLTGGTITSTGTISLSHLGIQSLTDPNADRILFWDDSAGTSQWLSLGTNLSISDTTLNASGATINNNVDNYVITATGTTGTLNGEANLTFNGSVLTVNGTACATCFVETSAQKYKTDIETFSCTDYFNCLRPVSFKWIENGSEDIGFIAEELNQFYPTLVAKSGEDEPTGVKYTKIVPLLVKKIQEQDTQINNLESKLNDIYNKINKDI